MKTRTVLAMLFLACLLLLGSGAALADGIIVVDAHGAPAPTPGLPGRSEPVLPPPVTPLPTPAGDYPPVPLPGPIRPVPPVVPPFPTLPPAVGPTLPPLTLTARDVKVSVTISDQVAQTQVEQVFVNTSSRTLEGSYFFPLPEDAAVSSFSMYVDGQKLDGILLNKDEARRIYEQTVRSQRDPALLEYSGRGAFQARLFPIPAHGQRTLRIEYTELLKREGDLVRYTYPLKTAQGSVQNISVHVLISGKEAIKSIYSPSSDVAVSRKGAYSAEASYEASGVRPSQDLILYYGLSGGEIGANLLTYRPNGSDNGFFLLLLSPQAEVDAARAVAKDVVLVLDTSGSMAGAKLTQAKWSLDYILNSLNPNDRFSLITFNSTVNRFSAGLAPAAQSEDARRFVSGLRAEGGTNIDGALREALQGLDAARPTVLIFLTDGLPTVGVTDANRIIENVRQSAPRSVRLFAFGVGYDVNTILLDSLAANQRGASAYVKPEENLEEVVSAFYSKVSRPVLTDISLDFGGLRVLDIYPGPLPDLFAGSQLVLSGRYQGASNGTVTLRGTLNGQSRQFTYRDLAFPQQTGSGTAFVARLWAQRRIGYLLTELRLHGNDKSNGNKELIDEVVALSTRYGIITPYTSFLVDERQNVLSTAGEKQASDQLGRTLATPAPAAGAAAVQDSEALRAMRQATGALPQAAPAAPTASAGSGAAPQRAAAQVQAVGDKTFISRGGAWIDTQYREGMSLREVAFGGSEYFALAARPEVAQYLALGRQVTVVLDGVAYRISGDAAADPGPLPPAGDTATPPPASATPSPTVQGPPSPTAASPTPVATAGPAAQPGFWQQVWHWLHRLFGR